jgi:hypothetical protein
MSMTLKEALKTPLINQPHKKDQHKSPKSTSPPIQVIVK